LKFSLEHFENTISTVEVPSCLTLKLISYQFSNLGMTQVGYGTSFQENIFLLKELYNLDT